MRQWYNNAIILKPRYSVIGQTIVPPVAVRNVSRDWPRSLRHVRHRAVATSNRTTRYVPLARTRKCDPRYTMSGCMRVRVYSLSVTRCSCVWVCCSVTTSVCDRVLSVRACVWTRRRTVRLCVCVCVYRVRASQRRDVCACVHVFVRARVSWQKIFVFFYFPILELFIVKY